MKLKKVTFILLLLTVLCGCTAQPSNNTNNILKTKTYLYSYDYETEPDGELITAYHEEKPSVDLNESRDVVKATVNFRKNTVTYIKMNETYSKGNYECTVKEAYKTSDVVGIVQATGTGKSYNALQICYDNQDKKIIYVVPSLGIIEHIKSIIEENPNYFI